VHIQLIFFSLFAPRSLAFVLLDSLLRFISKSFCFPLSLSRTSLCLFVVLLFSFLDVHAYMHMHFFFFAFVIHLFLSVFAPRFSFLLYRTSCKQEIKHTHIHTHTQIILQYDTKYRYSFESLFFSSLSCFLWISFMQRENTKDTHRHILHSFLL
jgi:hypothetical protein